MKAKFKDHCWTYNTLPNGGGWITGPAAILKTDLKCPVCFDRVGHWKLLAKGWIQQHSCGAILGIKGGVSWIFNKHKDFPEGIWVCEYAAYMHVPTKNIHCPVCKKTLLDSVTWSQGVVDYFYTGHHKCGASLGILHKEKK